MTWLNEKIKKHGISASKAAREALEEEAKKHETREIAHSVGEMKTLLNKIPDDEIVKAVREARNQR